MLKRPDYPHRLPPWQDGQTARKAEPPRTSSLILAMTLAVLAAAILIQGIPLLTRSQSIAPAELSAVPTQDLAAWSLV